MGRAPFIPARSSQHRIATLALYRALVKSASEVALPDQIGVVCKASKPLETIVRRRFEKNSIDTSPRLVFAALTAGYKVRRNRRARARYVSVVLFSHELQLLALLGKARDIRSPEYKQIIQKLSSMKRPPTQTWRQGSKTEPSATAATETREPLLMKISGQGEAPKYRSNKYPRPQNALIGPRRVPLVATTADGQPFLRTSSLQPHDMSRMIGQKHKSLAAKIDKIVEIQDELMPANKMEDDWERIIARQMREEGLEDEEVGAQVEIESTYIWSLHLSRLWYEWKIEMISQDWLARGEALQHIVDEEQRLADEEEGKMPTSAIKSKKHERSQAKVEGMDYKFISPPLSQVILSEADGHDIFSSRAWSEVVASKSKAMRSWAAEVYRG
ncbi:hypothetical protein NQ176_g5217 [Zarea fungicola]|uniref:Uncharacterized protein n=1 Tax=Zarea fungicola TaxID=93591 RepID=A0ACC1NAH0_9HYPO|nr:hypothetical protein NQ176_g5217 [Lecanicillium fungicola]